MVARVLFFSAPRQYDASVQPWNAPAVTRWRSRLYTTARLCILRSLFRTDPSSLLIQGTVDLLEVHYLELLSDRRLRSVLHTLP